MTPEDAVTTYERLIYTIASERIPGSVDWDDAIQEARIRVWEIHEKGRIPLDIRSPGAYIGQVIRRHITQVVTRQLWTGMDNRRGIVMDPLRTSARDSLDDPDFGFDSPAIIEALELAYHHGEIAAAINALPVAQREYVVMRFWGGMTGAEIAVRQHRPRGSLDREWSENVRPALLAELKHLR